MVTRGPAILATVVAISLINLGAALLIVGVVGQGGATAPMWLAVGLLAIGVIAAVMAITLWRGYLESLKA